MAIGPIQVARGYNAVMTVNGTQVGEARTVEYTLSNTKQDITSRLNAGWETTQPGKRVLKATTETLCFPANAFYKAMADCYASQGYFCFQMVDENGYGVSGTAMLDSLKPGPQDQENAIMCHAEFHSVGPILFVVANATTTAP